MSKLLDSVEIGEKIVFYLRNADPPHEAAREISGVLINILRHGFHFDPDDTLQMIQDRLDSELSPETVQVLTDVKKIITAEKITISEKS